jgi:predicted component of type VI protein secretion system
MQKESHRADLIVDRTITLCVTKGRFLNTVHQLMKKRASTGAVGGGADMQITDPDVSPIHCAVAMNEDGVRLYDLDSLNGTYVDEERIQVADLEHLSAFRIGSSGSRVYNFKSQSGLAVGNNHGATQTTASTTLPYCG